MHMQPSINLKRSGGKAQQAAPYLEVMTVRCCEQVVQPEDDHMRLLRDPILIPDIRHTGIVTNSGGGGGGGKQTPIEPEGLFNEKGSPKRALHKLVTETVRASSTQPVKLKRRPKKQQRQQQQVPPLLQDTISKGLPYDPANPHRKSPLVYRRPVPKEAFNILRSVRATAKEMDRTIFKK